jgi:hypothetical protein
MKICSFDVGIVNLAYCIINKNMDNFIIEKWGVINIDKNIIKCSHIIKHNNHCDKKATYALKLNNNITYYCTSHKKDHINLLNNFINNANLIDINKKCCYTIPKSGKICNKKSSNQINENVFCVTHFKGLCKLGKLKQVIATKKPFQNLGESMYNQLDEIKEMLFVDEILIENQPSLLNPSMKTISCLLYGYFIMRGIVEKHKTNSLIQNINFISPSNKLKIDGKNLIIHNKLNNNILNDTNLNDKKKEYILTKTIGIKYTQLLLEENNLLDSLKLLNEFDKKDDPCDAFLQGYHYLFNGFNVSHNIIEKLNNELIKMNEKQTKNNKIKI